MSTVISIDAAKSFADRTEKISENTRMNTLTDLYRINLPIGTDHAPKSVLALVADRKPNSLRLILSDKNRTFETRTIIGSGIPDAYAPVPIADNCEAFLSKHGEAASAILMAGGALHGNLTIARAVDLMINEDLDPYIALDSAIQIADECSVWNHKLKAATQEILNAA